MLLQSLMAFGIHSLFCYYSVRSSSLFLIVMMELLVYAIYMTKKRMEIIFFYLFFFFAAASGVYLKLNFLIFTAFYTIPIILYLSFKLKKYIKKILIEALIISVPMEIVLDSIAHLSKSWYVFSVLGIRIFGDIPLDDLIWTFLYVLLVLLSYTYLFDHYKSKKLKKSFGIMSLVFLTILFIFVLVNNFFPTILVIPYFYSILIAGFLIFTLIVLLKHPRMYQNISLMGLYMLIPSILFEYVALELGHWYFEKGYHLAYILIGKYSVPVKEFLFYSLAIASTILIHELFGDNKRNI